MRRISAMIDHFLHKVEPMHTRSQVTVLGILLAIESGLVFVTSTWFLQSAASSIPSAPTTISPLPTWLLGLANAGIVLIVYGGLGLAGYWLAHKLGWPGVFCEHAGWRDWLFQPLLVGVTLGIAIIVLDRLFALISTRNLLPHPTFPLSLMASMGAGIGEEILFRLFLLSFWAFLLTLLLGRWCKRGSCYGQPIVSPHWPSG